jgi:hypothetical protein
MMRIVIDGVHHADHFEAIAALEACGVKRLELLGERSGPDETLLAAAMTIHAARHGVPFMVERRPEGLRTVLEAVAQLVEIDAAIGRGEADPDAVAAEINSFLAGVVRSLRLVEIDLPNLLALIHGRGRAAQELN